MRKSLRLTGLASGMQRVGAVAGVFRLQAFGRQDVEAT